VIRATPLRSRARWLLAAALLFVVNVVWLVSFQILYVRREAARSAVARNNGEKIDGLLAQLQKGKTQLGRLRTLGADRDRFYSEILGRADARFTDRIRRLRELAGRSDVRIFALTFSDAFPGKVPVRLVEIQFQTDARYENLKKFLNAVEVDDAFLYPTALTLSRNDPASGRAEVNFGIRIRTAFHDPSGVREQTRRRSAPPAAKKGDAF
jgi:hypothetical protein